MKTHFEAIGFPLTSGEAINAFIPKALAHPKAVQSKDTKLHSLIDDSGAHLCFTLNHVEKRIDSVTPLYRGPTTVPFCITSPTEEGEYYGWIGATDEKDPETGICPVVMDIPNAYQFLKKKSPTLVKVNVTGIPDEFTLYKDVQAFEKGESKLEVTFAAQSFMPRYDKKGEVLNGAWVNGIIRKVTKHKNTITKCSFYSLEVDTLFTLTVVVDRLPGLLAPKPGSIFSGRCWLGGEVTSSK